MVLMGGPAWGKVPSSSALVWQGVDSEHYLFPYSLSFPTASPYKPQPLARVAQAGDTLPGAAWWGRHWVSLVTPWGDPAKSAYLSKPPHRAVNEDFTWQWARKPDELKQEVSTGGLRYFHETGGLRGAQEVLALQSSDLNSYRQDFCQRPRTTQTSPEPRSQAQHD